MDSLGHEEGLLLALPRLTGTRVALFRHLDSELKPSEAGREICGRSMPPWMPWPFSRNMA
ncbi:hypothetical protein [Myxococcus sp. Y35]|uniref:hypothetical protein n=1 Tax=Pseudomyxococcus flavus TaxID=3115648 RepID=UPI003CFAECCB